MKLEARISGQKVHQVGYRVFLLNAAIEFGCRRFSAQNLFEDGNQVLIVHLEGDDVQMKEFEEFVRARRPDGAEIIEITFRDFQGYVMSVEDYMHISMVDQLNKGIPALLSINEKQDQMLEKQDKMIEKQDIMIEKQDQVLIKLDEIREDVVDEMRASKVAIVVELKENRDHHEMDIKDLRVDLRSYLDEKLGKMENDIVLIKAKIGLS